MVETRAAHALGMTMFTMPLNNFGDEVQVVDPKGVIRHQVSYTAAQVQPGMAIAFQ
jgi:hypothetical protein